jgi:hypothetical protein
MARRNLAHNIQAVRYELTLELERRNPIGVRRHQESGLEPGVSASLLACMIVSAVTEVGRPQPAHSQVNALVFRTQARPSPQPEQTNPFGQRHSKRYSAHALSAANQPWNSINDLGDRP